MISNIHVFHDEKADPVPILCFEINAKKSKKTSYVLYLYHNLVKQNKCCKKKTGKDNFWIGFFNTKSESDLPENLIRDLSNVRHSTVQTRLLNQFPYSLIDRNTTPLQTPE